MHLRFIIYTLIFILADGNLYAKKYIAFSLKNAQKTISSLSNSDSLKKNFPELFKLYGINEIKGALYDKKNNDLIIIGSINPKSDVSLNLDDIVTVLRSIFIYGREPYISLGSEKSQIYFEGGIKNTDLGNKLLSIAVNIKKMVKNVRIERLFFISVVPEVRVKKDVVLINGFRQYIFPSNISGLQEKLDFHKLKAISQLIALAQGIEQMRIDKADLWFWLRKYKINPSNIEKLQVKNNLKPSLAIKVIGIIFHSETAEMKKLKKMALKKRARRNDVSWDFEIKDKISDFSLSKEMEKAIQLFCKALFLYKIKKSYYQAIDIYSRIIEMMPEWDLPYYFRAAIYNELKQYKKAIKDYNKVIKINPEYSMAYINQGYTYNYIGRHKKAIKVLNKAIALSPYHIDAYNNRGIAYCGIGKYKKGIMDFDNVIKIASDFVLGYLNKGKAYFCLGDYKKAIEVLNKAIRIAPDFSEAYCNRGIAYRYLGEYKKAIQDFDKAIQINPYYAYAYVQRGLTYEDLCEWKKADLDIEKAVKLDPGIFSAYIFSVTKLNPRTAVEFHERGHAYFCIGQWKKAIEDFNKAINLKSDFASAYFYRALCYDNLRDYKNAILDYTHAIQLIPDNAIMYNNRGTAYYSCHEYEKALRDFNKAIELEPENPVFYENRVRVYSRLGENKKACMDARHACELGRCRFYRILIKKGICKNNP